MCLRLQNRVGWPRLIGSMVVATAALMVAFHWIAANYGLGIDPQRHASVRAYGGGTPRVYLLSYKNREFARGQIVALPLPPEAREELSGAGFKLPSSVLMKRVAGLPGEKVRIDTDGVWVRVASGLALAKSLRRPAESFHRTLTLRSDEYLLLGDTADSFDARYWGPVPASAIAGSATILYSERAVP